MIRASVTQKLMESKKASSVVRMIKRSSRKQSLNKGPQAKPYVPTLPKKSFVKSNSKTEFFMSPVANQKDMIAVHAPNGLQSHVKEEKSDEMK